MLRSRRGFDARAWLTAKSTLINDYLRASGLKAAVVGVSGGVDSAVVLGLLRHAARLPGSPLQRVLAAILPLRVPEGVTNQALAARRGHLVAEAFASTRVRRVELDLSAAYTAARDAAERGLDVRGGAWAAGQLASNIRAPALYYLATLLTQEGAPALVCGTTNRDEGGYIGFFGKASDGMVDLQPIADLHKSEVFAVGRLLGVPRAVLAAIPTGDTFDGRVDEAMIGAPYEFVELFQLLRAQPDESTRARWLARLSPAARAQLDEGAARLERRHQGNAHKYIAGSPAVFLDVMPRAVPGGWRERVAPGVPSSSLETADIVGRFTLDPAIAREVNEATDHWRPAATPERLGDASTRLVRGLLTSAERERLRLAVADAPWVPVGRDGRRPRGDSALAPEAIGSWRATAHDEALARALWDRLRTSLPLVRTVDDPARADGDRHRVWRAVGLNPLLRFIRYEPGGWLVPHHDAGFDFGDGHHRTLMSALLYIETDARGEGGATRFVLDPRRHEPTGARDYDDWTRPPEEHELLERVPPEAGAALVFDHRVLHDGARWEGPGQKLLLRTDVVFRRCGVQAIPARPSASVSLPPLWILLGRSPGASRAELDAAYASRRSELRDAEASALRDAWKLLRDPLYAAAYTQLGSREAMDEAGFFDDGGDFEARDDPREDPRWLTTPLHRVRERLAAARAGGHEPEALAVLVTTGALCPVHAGHVEMMNIARRALERRGVHVLGGYLSPDHNGYVGAKRGADALPASVRLARCEQAARASDWLMVDPWNALHTPRALNFSEVLARLDRYLSRHVQTVTKIRVVYVFGSDNARFALAFAARGHAVCVRRPGHADALARYAGDPRVQGNPRVLMVDDASARALASSELPPPALEPGPEGSARLYLRDEGDWLLAPWLHEPRRRVATLRRAHARFLEELVAALTRGFGAAAWPERARALTVERLELDAAAASASAELRGGARALSLDPCLPAQHNLGLSRCYTLCDGRRRAALVARPGWPPIAEQLRALPEGDYVLLDDDTVTGETLERVRELLPTGRALERAEFLCRVDEVRARCPEGALIDLCDARDFLVGAREGGLVVELPNGLHARAPYLLPYVRPSARVSLPATSELRFSRSLWRANLEFFARAPALRVRDMSPAFQVLARYLDFAADATMTTLCQWHLDRLRGPQT